MKFIKDAGDLISVEKLYQVTATQTNLIFYFNDEIHGSDFIRSQKEENDLYLRVLEHFASFLEHSGNPIFDIDKTIKQIHTWEESSKRAL